MAVVYGGFDFLRLAQILALAVSDLPKRLAFGDLLGEIVHRVERGHLVHLAKIDAVEAHLLGEAEQGVLDVDIGLGEPVLRRVLRLDVLKALALRDTGDDFLCDCCGIRLSVLGLHFVDDLLRGFSREVVELGEELRVVSLGPVVYAVAVQFVVDCRFIRAAIETDLLRRRVERADNASVVGFELQDSGRIVSLRSAVSAFLRESTADWRSVVQVNDVIDETLTVLVDADDHSRVVGRALAAGVRHRFVAPNFFHRLWIVQRVVPLSVNDLDVRVLEEVLCRANRVLNLVLSPRIDCGR